LKEHLDQYRADDPRVEAALQEYLERLERGEAVDRKAFLAGYPDIANTLANFIAAEEELRKLLGDKTSRESAGMSTRSFAAQGQETVRPELQPERFSGKAGSRLEGRFGRYQIIRALGKGAMGAVYLAHDTQLKRQVAIKTPHFEDNPTGELLQRFYREAEAAATLRHANICPIHDVGEIDGKHFISMAYIEGRPLSDLIRGGKTQNERKIQIAVHKLAQGLQHAHDHGIVHRDLKPANIMVDNQGEPIIMDFGLARKRRAEGEASLTHSGVILGSPAYMSPEQVEADPESVGPASDQYSLGVVLYEMLTGQLPFRGSVANVLAQILTAAPTPPSERRPGLDPRIEAVCLRMMAKKASDRFPSMKAVADQIAAIVKNPAAASTNTAPVVAESSATASVPLAAPAPSQGDARASQIGQSLNQRSIRPTDVTSIEELVRKCLRCRDYDQAIQIIERIPEERRNESLKTLLEKAREKVDEIAFLICEIDEADRLQDRQTALKKAEALLELKPGHHRAKEMQQKYSGYGNGGAARIGPLSPFTKPWNEGGWIPWSVLAFGLAVFAVTYGVIVLYLGNKTAIVVDIKDPGVEVTVKGSTLTLTGPNKQSVKVEPGDQELKITTAGLEMTTKSFSLKKGETKAVTVSIVNKQIFARLANEILPLTANPEKTASISPLAGKKEVVAIGSPETIPGDAPRKFFKPFLVRGEWKIENDELVQPTLAAVDMQPLLVFGEADLSNYDLSLQVRKTGGSDSMGVMFHWLGPGYFRRYLLARNNWINFDYEYGRKWGREDGNGKWQPYSSNRWYSLKIEVRGATYRAYLDDMLQFVYSEPRFTHGRICLFTFAAASRFRRIKVSDPEGKVLFEGLPELSRNSDETSRKSEVANGSPLPNAAETAAVSAQKQCGEQFSSPVISTNSLGTKLALIPPGEFQMGSPESEPARGGHEQQHRVRITKPFYLGVTEVTQSEFERVMERNPSVFRNCGGDSEKTTGPDTSRNPVDSVSWFDAIEFCNKLSKKEGLQAYYRIAEIKRQNDGWIKHATVSVEGGNGYHLPTEAQWEYACRAGTTTPFSFGAVNNGSECNCNGGQPYGTEEKGPALGRTVPVGSFRPNAFGLCDMHGNVVEWCWDVYDDAFYQHSPASDPLGPSDGTKRVIRGEGYGGPGSNCRSAWRYPVIPADRGFWGNLGFRFARDVIGGRQFEPPKTNNTSSGSVLSVPADPNRRAAEAVLALGGSVVIGVNDQERKVQPGQTLPDGPFLLTAIRLHDKPQLRDSDLEPLEGIANLRHLSLNKVPNVTDRIIVHLRNCKQLETFWFENSPVGDTGLAYLEEFTALKSLGLRGTHVSDAGMPHLEPLRQLEHVALGGTVITSAGLVHLRGLNRLEKAWIERTRIGDSGLVHLEGLANLKRLILFGTRVTGAGLAHLKGLVQLENLMLGGLKVGNADLASLEGLTSLKSLWLDGTRITDAGLVHLQRLTHLEQLVLRHTSVSDAGLEKLKGMTALRELNVVKTRVTAAGAAHLKKSLPQCEIEL
jgi:serine/threonine protein kinase/formylglycine-generating enzyme required for sulfatase activity